MTDIEDMDFGLEVTKSVIAKAIQAMIGFAGTVLFARLLGPTAFGGFYLLLSLIQLVNNPFVGWSIGVKKRVSEASTDRQELVGTQLLINTIGIFVVIVLSYQIRHFLADYSGISSAWILFAILLISLVLFEPLQKLLDANGQVSLSTWIDTLRSLLTTSFQLALVLLGFGAAGMAIGLAGATLSTAVVTQYYLRVRPRFPSGETTRSVFQFAKYSTLTGLVGKAYDRYDTLLIGFLLVPGAVADYEVAAKLTIPAIFVSNAINAGLLPKVSNLQSRGESVATDITNSLAYGCIIAIPLFFGALALPQEIVVTTYGGEYSGAARLIAGIALIRVVSIKSSIFASSLQGLDMPDIPLKVSATTLVINILTGYVLVLEIGALGAVIATILAESIQYVVMGTIVRRKIPSVTVVPSPVFHQITAGFIMFLAIKGIQQVIVVRSWVDLLLVVGVGAGIYAGMLLSISSPVRTRFKSLLKELGILHQ